MKSPCGFFQFLSACLPTFSPSHSSASPTPRAVHAGRQTSCSRHAHQSSSPSDRSCYGSCMVLRTWMHVLSWQFNHISPVLCELHWLHYVNVSLVVMHAINVKKTLKFNKQFKGAIVTVRTQQKSFWVRILMTSVQAALHDEL